MLPSFQSMRTRVGGSIQWTHCSAPISKDMQIQNILNEMPIFISFFGCHAWRGMPTIPIDSIKLQYIHIAVSWHTYKGTGCACLGIHLWQRLGIVCQMDVFPRIPRWDQWRWKAASESSPVFWAKVIRERERCNNNKACDEQQEREMRDRTLTSARCLPRIAFGGHAYSPTRLSYRRSQHKPMRSQEEEWEDEPTIKQSPLPTRAPVAFPC